MRTLPRTLAGCLLAAYAAAATLPCTGESTAGPGRAAAGHEHGAPAPEAAGGASHHGHGTGHGGNGHAGPHHAPAPAPDPTAEWTAPCPCGCDGATETAGSSSPRVGWALALRLPGLTGSTGTADLALPAPHAPADPLRGPEPVPI